MAEPSSSLRQIAQSLGLSHTTVSEALRGSPKVRPGTRERVLAAAEAVGYRPNPLAGAIMSEMRRSRMDTFRGVLAILDIDGPENRPAAAVRYHTEVTGGARSRAEELGFKTDMFVLGNGGMSLARLDTILRSRGIRGLLVLPVREVPDLTGLDLNHLAAVYTDYVMKDPVLHSVCPDHYMAMMNLIPRLRALGYSRLGLALSRKHDERLLYHWQAAFSVCVAHQAGHTKIPPLIADEITREAFMRWFKKEKPDLVMCHHAEVIPWMESCGASVPETHGFCSLNVNVNIVPCAGLDFHPRLIGALAIELLTGQLLRNDCGAPKIASITTIPPIWVDGPTVRSAANKPVHAGKRKAKRS